MTEQELLHIIEQDEGYYTEFKRNVNTSLSKEMVSFANSSGGSIFIGIDDDGSIPGINITNKLLSQVQTMATDCDPSIYIKTEKIGSNVLRIIVPEGNAKPYKCTSGFYTRNGANAQKMKTDAIINFIEKEGRTRFDEQVRKDVDFSSNFSNDNWIYFAQLSKIDKNQDPFFILKSLGAVKDIDGINYFTNAGLLVFCKNSVLFLPQATVSCVLYKGTEKVDIIDRKEFDGDIIQNINNTMQFIERHINVAAKIESVQRQDIWEIPQVAIREAIVNAFAHRDYLEKGARVMIEIFDDRLVISNPGGLPKGLDESDFGKYSLTRNAVLASILLRTNYIEKLGTGINRINKALTDIGQPKATFKFNHFFTVTFKRIAVGQKSSEKSSEQGSEKSSEKILALLQKDKHLSAVQMAKKIGITARAVEKQLAQLKQKGIIKRIGPAKGGYWKINR